MDAVLGAVLNTVNPPLRDVVAAGLRPFAAFPPVVGLVVWSAVFGVLAAIAFRYTSNQRGLKRVAEQLRANLLAMRLFKDDLWVTLRTQAALFRAAGLRLWYSLPPMLVMIIPFGLLITHLAMWYEFRPLAPGEATVVTVKLANDAWPVWKDAALQAPEGIAVETPAVRDSREKAVSWRVRATAPGAHRLRWEVGEQSVEKLISVAGGDPDRVLAPASPVRAGASVGERLLYPLEPGLPADGPVREIVAQMPARDTPLLGWSLPWWLTFLIVTMAAALLVKPLMRVQF